MAFSTRLGGVSAPPYDSLNLSVATGDDPERVAANRERLSAALGLAPAWGPTWALARQVHGCGVLVDPAAGGGPEDADAVVVHEPGRPAAVLVADCVPIALVGEGVAAAVHAGWRGLCAGVIEAAVSAIGAPRDALVAWIGPCIGPCCYEVGPEVSAAFVARRPGAPACTRTVGGATHFDLRAAATWVLARAGVAVAEGDAPSDGLTGGPACTACDPRFFSHRRDARGGGTTGRQALVVWVP
ncbi:MAG TPA: polyphenol oxidase family protein [Actinomycetota bacterium]|nr:polyphenol oxidase family protein [Actinomycetota bacterium]